MSRSLRYQQPDVQEHLASQYVLGTLSPRTKRRFERLMNQLPELEARVYRWQQRMNAMNENTEAVPPPSWVWQNLERKLMVSAADKPVLSGWWNQLGLWRFSVLLLAAVLVGVLNWPQQPAIQAVNYMATMTAEGSSKAEPLLVITAYKGDAPGRSHLHLQWNERQQQTALAGLTLWAVSREDGTPTPLGALSRTQQQRLLSKAEWLAIKDSAELVIVRGTRFDDPVVYRGPCLQLSPWQDQQSG